MTGRSRILVVDDDEKIRTLLRRYLTEEGFDVHLAAEGAAMRAALERQGADLVLLDLVLPGEDGLSLIQYLRKNHGKLPVIVLTGKGDVIDRVVGLESGADDYVAKPFHLRELLARIRTVLRRADAAPAAAPAPESRGGVYEFQGWQLDTVRRELRRPGGETVELTSGEYDLLHAFAGSPNRVLSRDQLMDLVKGRAWAANDRAIDTQIVRLRKKIERDPKRPELVKTVRAAGYIFATPVQRR
jgi:two-component system phosphate regulon response regulator OmpR